MQLPLFSTQVQAGFPSPAEDYLEKHLDLNEHLIQHPAATFFVRVNGDSMKEAGIHPGDILIIDRALDAKEGKIVLAVIDGEFTVKRIRIEGEQVFLDPENSSYQPIKVNPESSFEVWGVVTYVIHSC